MKHSFIFVLLSTVVAGCATVTPLSEQSSKQLNNKSLAHSQYPKGLFSATTFEIAARGAFAGADAISAGNAIVQKYEIEDPASSVANTLGEGLQSKFGTSLSPATGVSVSNDLHQLTKQYEHSDLLLDVQTTQWGFGFFPMNWSHYRIMYGVRARLIDVKTMAILAEGTCTRSPETDEGAPTYAELLRDNAARLRQELQGAAQYCAEKLRADIFKS